VLLVGDSSRAFVESEEDRASFGEDEGRGSDSIVLVRIDPEAGTAATLPFPRDLWVELADGSGAQRINRAYELGGARLLVQTIQERFGVPVHHYVGVDFEGFRELVDAIGGVTISLDAPVRDHNRRTGRNESGLDIPTAGCVTLDGDQALAYVRSRHFERFVFLRWVPDGRNDFGRSVRQQQFLRQVLDQATSDGLLSPARVLDLLAIADENVTFSDDLDADRIAELVGYARRLSPSAYTDYALPVTDLTTAAGALVLEIVPEEAEPVLQVFRGVPPPAGAGRAGRAGRASGAAGRRQRDDRGHDADEHHLDGAVADGPAAAALLAAAGPAPGHPGATTASGRPGPVDGERVVVAERRAGLVHERLPLEVVAGRGERHVVPAAEQEAVDHVGVGAAVEDVAHVLQAGGGEEAPELRAVGVVGVLEVPVAADEDGTRAPGGEVGGQLVEVGPRSAASSRPASTCSV
jgi:LCP family protein required for cell wall assembly